MKVKELKLMNEPDLENKIIELRKELMKINSQIAIGTALKNPSKVREMKRTLAKILTIKHEKISNKFFVSRKPQIDFPRQQKGGNKKE